MMMGLMGLVNFAPSETSADSPESLHLRGRDGVSRGYWILGYWKMHFYTH